MKDSEFVQIVMTTDQKDQAEDIARALVEKRLAACVQIVGPIVSIYRWKGAMETAQEWQCLIKSRRDLFETIESIIISMHTYEVPEIIMLPITGGHTNYLRWLDENVEPG